MDLLLYISRGAPELYPDEITRYPITNDWSSIITQSNQHAHDDGHLSKLVRALKNAEENVCRPFEGQAQTRGLKVTGDAWLKIANMGEFFIYSPVNYHLLCYKWFLTRNVVNDSVKGRGEDHMWVRSTGFDEAWTQFEDRARL